MSKKLTEFEKAMRAAWESLGRMAAEDRMEALRCAPLVRHLLETGRVFSTPEGLCIKSDVPFRPGTGGG